MSQKKEESIYLERKHKANEGKYQQLVNLSEGTWVFILPFFNFSVGSHFFKIKKLGIKGKF